MTARGMSLRICWDCHRGCCEAGPPPSMPRCRVSIHENLERILWLRKRRRRRRPRRRRPRSRRRSEFWPGWSAQLRPGSQLRVQFGEWRAASPPFSFRDQYVARMSDSDIRDDRASAPDFAEPVIGRAFARPVGSSGLQENFSAPPARAWRRARQIPPQSSGAARPSPLGG
jgi:hypothetical protein